MGRQRKLPVITGTLPPLVSERPVCMFCGKRREPEYRITPDRKGNDKAVRVWTGKYHGDGHFCSLRHAAAYGNWAAADALRRRALS